MTWLKEDGKEMADLTLHKLKENDGILTKYQVWDIIDSNLSFGFRKTMIHASKYLEGYGIVKTKDGGMTFNEIEMTRYLREETGFGMLDCKKALEKTDGNIIKAKEYLIERGRWSSLARTDTIIGWRDIFES